MNSVHRSSLRGQILAGILALLAVNLGPANATVFVPMTDEELADRTSLILEGRVLAVEASPGQRPAVDYLFEVERLVKGYLPGSALVVRVPGGVRADGIGLRLRGAPRFRESDRALLFLAPRSDGTFAIQQFMLGAFHIVVEGPSRVAVRDLSRAMALAPASKAGPHAADDPPRDLARFRRWLEDRSAGRHRAADYLLTEPLQGGAKFRTLVSPEEAPPLGCGANGGNSVRWFNFDLGESVSWRTYFSGQEGVPDGGVNAFQRALAAWNSDPNTNIAYEFAGLTGATAGLTENDGINAVLFGDPNDEIAGSFAGSGVLAVGGPWFDCNLLGHEGENFHPVFGADIVTQDGLELFFAAVPDAQKAAEQIFGHELGHTLGLDHSQDPQALMRADYHPDRRGAAPDVDDLAGMLYLYGPRDLEPPLPPADLRASPTPIGKVRLEWSDLASNESAFRLERRVGESFELLRIVAADTTTFVDSSAAPTTLYRYRLRAQNGAGASPYSNEVEILTPEDPRPDMPTNLRAAPLSSTEIRLAWQDNSDDETAFVVDILVDGSWVEVPVELPANTRRVIAEGLTPGLRFAFRVRAINDFGSSPSSNAASAATFAEDTACSVTGDKLCLLGGRFEVSVRYRNTHGDNAEGVATVVPSTDESGLFWFFGPENIELIFKILDGRQLNESFWVFYGALSDLEYWIEVTDTANGTTRTYHNPPGEICGRADTSAFFDEEDEQNPLTTPVRRFIRAVHGPAVDVETVTLTPSPVTDDPDPEEMGPCVQGRENLCLLDGRLSASVRWRNPQDGSEGAGQAIVDTVSSGFFWFFNIENTELGIKALDGQALNDYLWFFYGALTDLEYWITLTDMESGESRVYYNPPGEVCGQADTEAFPSIPEGSEDPTDDP